MTAASRTPRSRRSSLVALAGILATLGLTVAPPAASASAPVALTADVRVDTSCAGASCTGSTLAEANTTRKIAVSPAGTNGTIFVAFRANDGIHVATSTDRGATFAAPVRVSTAAAEPAIAATANAVYVAFSSGGSVTVVKGALDATTWEAAVSAGAGSGQNHLSVESGATAATDRLYLIDQPGTRVLRSIDGGATFSSTSLPSSWVFSDVQVDPRTGDVYALVDRPAVSFYRSTDQAATFGAEVPTGADIFFSVSALTSTPSQTLLYAAGSGTNFERFLLPAGTRSTTTVLGAGASQARSIAADDNGTVVIGLIDGGTLKFQVSADFGASFSEGFTLAAGTRSNAEINPKTGDLLLLYEASNQIFLTVYGIAGIRSAAPSIGGLDGTSGSGDSVVDQTVNVAIQQSGGLTGTEALLVRGGQIVPTSTTLSGPVGPRGGVVIEDETGELRISIAAAGGTSPTGGIVVAPDGEIVCEICARLAAGSVIEAWILSTPRLAAAVQVEDGVCPLLRIPVGAPLDGGGSLTPGVHTLQLRMYTPTGFEVLAIPITIGDRDGAGAPVPSSVPTGGGPRPLPNVLVSGLLVALLMVMMTLGYGGALADTYSAVRRVREVLVASTGPIAGRTLHGFDALEQRLEELRTSLRSDTPRR